MVWISLMLVGMGFLILWIWTISSKNRGSVILLRKKGNPSLEKNTTVMESQSGEFFILFSAGSSKLEKQSLDLLRVHFDPEFLSHLGYVCLIGSADASGHLATNRRLVKERIRIVERCLVTFGISKDKIRKIFLEPSYGRSPELRRLLRSVKIQYKMET